MARKRKTQPAAQFTELAKPAPFVPKVKDVNAQFLPAVSKGRPFKYDPKETPKETWPNRACPRLQWLEFWK